MKRIVRYTVLGLSLLTLYAEDKEIALPRHLLTNEGIVTLAEAGYDEDFLIDLIQCKQTRFDTTVDGLAFLAKHGISEKIVRVMIDNESKSASPATNLTETPVAAPAAPPAMAVPARVVRTVVAGTPVQPVTAAVAAAPPYVVVKRHWFRSRWYIVNPPPAPFAPLQSSWSLFSGW